jgi:tRNA(fMet)-specific endonuclease VapC
MKLSLDTGVAIEVIRGRQPHYREWLEAAEADGATLHLSSIVFHELMLGAMTSARPKFQMERVGWLAALMEVEPWTPDDAAEAARIRADLMKSSAAMGAMDILIAGQAINNGWTLVTGALRDLIHVPNLQILDWSDPAGPLNRDQAWLRVMRRPAK